MKIKKLIISKRFLDSVLHPSSKMFLLELLHASNDGVLNIDDYNALCLVYIPLGLIVDFNWFTYNEDQKTIKLNIDKFKALGITLRDRKVVGVPVDTEKGHELLKCYNEVRGIVHKGEYSELIRLTPARSNDINNCIKFLENNKIEDWFLYFYCLHDCAQWTSVWPLKNCYCAKAIDIYLGNKDRCTIKIKERNIKMLEEINNLQAEKTGTKPSRWFSLYEHIEDKKARLIKRGQEHICLGRISELLGYTPKSSVCTKCPIKAACAQEIYNIFQMQSKSDLDILQIRAEKVSIEQANARLKELGLNFDFYA